jgi:outer membrane receptor protein involved in Fe transport
VLTYRARLLPFAALLLTATLQITSLSTTEAAALHEPLPPQPLSDALLTLAEQFNVLLIYSTELSEGITSQGAPVGLSLDDTLHAVLEGTDLTYELIDGRIVVIHSKGDDKSRKGPQQPGDAAPESSQQVPAAVSDSKHQEGNRAGPGELWNQVIITGTHIPGESPVGAHPTTLTREYIDERAYATVADVIRALPQNFGGGPSEDTWHIGQDEVYNTSRGMGLNLRGLGAGSTLVLLNGRRLAAGGGDGRFVDVSGIPLTAIERIDVLPDGASAIYGADAVGGVVNFELRRDYDGAESQVRFGASTFGEPSQFQVAQTVGQTWPSGNALASLELYKRSEVPAAARLQSRDSDLRALGGDNFDIAEGNPGTILSPLITWPIPLGQNGQGLTAANFTPGAPNFHNRNEGTDLLPDQRRWSLVGTLNQELGEWGHLFADLLFSDRNTEVVLGPTKLTLAVPSTNPFYVNPVGGSDPVFVAYSFARDLGPEIDQAEVRTTSATLGIDVPAQDWMITPAISVASYHDRIEGSPLVDQAALALALADSDPKTAFNPFGDGSFTNPATLEKLRVDALLDRQTKLRSATIAANGSLGRWFDREVRIALGGEVRRERLDSLGLPSAVTLVNWQDKRTVYAGYAEVLVPLIDQSHKRFGVESLRLSIADRYEHYSDFGGLPTPRYGLNWSPVPGVEIRGSWSKSFKAPNLVDRDDSRNFSVLTSLPDQAAKTGFSQVLLWFGNNPALHEEKATTWTLGTDLKVPSRGLAFEFTYFNLKYRDRVDRVDFSPSILLDSDLGALVTRDPSAAQKEEVCRRDRFLGDLTYCLSTPVNVLLDLRLANVALMRTSGVDASIAYETDSRFGRFEAGLNATYVIDFSKARYYTSPLNTYVDEPGYPLRFRGKADLLWERNALSVIGVLNYAGPYTDSLSSPERFVHPWTTVDLAARYRLGAHSSSALNDVTIDLNTQNVFDKRPPFVNNPIGVAYDPENADLLGRFIGVGIRKEW